MLTPLCDPLDTKRGHPKGSLGDFTHYPTIHDNKHYGRYVFTLKFDGANLRNVPNASDSNK